MIRRDGRATKGQQSFRCCSEAPRGEGLAYGNYVQEYRKGAVNGASPVQLVIMLYDGALRFMEAGKAAMNNGDLEKQNHSLQRAQRIIMELMSSLDMERGGEISTNLLALYTFVIEQLVKANIEDVTSPIDHAMHTMSELRESWVQIDRLNKQAPPEEIQLAA